MYTLVSANSYKHSILNEILFFLLFSAGRDIVNYTVRDNVAIVTLNDKSARVNTLSEKVMQETLSVLQEVTHNPDVKSVVMISAKPDCFIAGADINMLGAANSVEAGTKISRDGQRILGMIEDSKKPVVAAISGSCLGGGLEVSLLFEAYTISKTMHILSKNYNKSKSIGSRLFKRVSDSHTVLSVSTRKPS